MGFRVPGTAPPGGLERYASDVGPPFRLTQRGELQRLSPRRNFASATAVVALALGLAAPTGASAGPVADLLDQVGSSLDEVGNTVGGATGGGAPSAAPQPQAGVPPTYTPPAHGTNPHGQGTVGVVDLTPEETEPLPYDPDGGSEDIVVGRSRGEQNGDEYHGHITVVSTFLTGELVGVDTNEGEKEAGPLEPAQENVLDSLCDGSGDQICLEVLRANSETTEDGSTNRFVGAGAQLGGPTGISAAGAKSNGNISDDGECQTAHGDSTVFEASVGEALTADVLKSSSDSTACNDGSETVQQDSRVVDLNEAGLPVPAPGCENGTPDSNFDPLLPLLGAVCNADDVNNGQMEDPYGVREALSLFVLDLGGTPLVKTTTAAAESHAEAPGEEPPPQCPDPDNPDCPQPPECPDPENPDCPDGPDGPDRPDGPGGPDGPSAKSPNEAELPFTGADLTMMAGIGVGVMAAGLALMARADRRRRRRAAV